MSELEVTPLANAGAQVTGVDWADPASTEKFGDELYAAWLEHGVLIFPKAGASSEIHVRLSRVFGELEIHPLKALQAKDYPELAPFGLQEGEELRNSGVMCNGEHIVGFLYAHQDTSYTANLCKGSMLRMLRVPEAGGDTRFWDTAKAYRALPDAMKAKVGTLSTIQTMRIPPPRRLWGMAGETAEPVDLAYDMREMEKYPSEWAPVLHPMVTTHPESGLKLLILSPQGYVKIEGMEQDESDALFDEIATHALDRRFEYRHHWSVGDMVLWDNRRMMHMAAGWPYALGPQRFAYRTTLKGGMEVGRPYAMPDGPEKLSVFV
jgi:taurine dioxygenase